MRKVIRAAMLASVAALTFSAVSPAEAATYRWLRAVPQSEPVNGAIQQLIADYKKDHPDFDLQIEFAADRPSYLQKIKILATSGELPDLFDADAEPYFADIVANDLVANIGNLFDEIGITDKFFPLALDYERLDDGSLFLIPFGSNTEYFFYHPSMFEKAGVSVPKTLDEFAATCKAIGAKGMTPISISGKDGWPSYRYLSMPAFRETGNQFLNDLKQGKVSMTSPVGVESARFLQDVGKHCFQQGYTTTDYSTMLNLFTSGEAAILYIGTWALPSMLEDAGKLKPDIAYFKMPMIEGKSATRPSDFYAHSGIGTAIKTGSDTDEMKDFLRYFADKFPDLMLYQYKVLPSLKPTIKPELPAIYKDILTDIENVKTYTQVWDVKLDASTVDTLFRQSQLLILGQVTPEQFGAEIDNSIQQYIAGR